MPIHSESDIVYNGVSAFSTAASTSSNTAIILSNTSVVQLTTLQSGSLIQAAVNGASIQLPNATTSAGTWFDIWLSMPTDGILVMTNAGNAAFIGPAPTALASSGSSNCQLPQNNTSAQFSHWVSNGVSWVGTFVNGIQGAQGPAGTSTALPYVQYYLSMNSENPIGTTQAQIVYGANISFTNLNVNNGATGGFNSPINITSNGVCEVSMCIPIYYSSTPTYFYVDITYIGTGVVHRHYHKPSQYSGAIVDLCTLSFAVVGATSIGISFVCDATYYIGYYSGTTINTPNILLKRIS